MLDWDRLKLDIYKEVNNYPLIKKDNALIKKDPPIHQLSWNLPEFEFTHFFSTLGNFPKFFWSNKEASTEVMGLGIFQEYKTEQDIEQIEKTIAKENLDVKLFASFQFENTPTGKKKNKGCPLGNWENFEKSHYIIPTILFIKEDRNFRIVINLSAKQVANDTAKARTIFELDHLLSLNFDRLKRIDLVTTEYQPSRLEWNQMLLKSELMFKKSKLNKVVLARKKVLTFEGDDLAKNIFIKLSEQRSLNDYFFYWEKTPGQVFLGISPETLFKRSDRKLNIDSLAGTRPRGTTKESDQSLGEVLLNSKKDLKEHRIVTDWIKEAMSELVDAFHKNKTEKLLKLRHVQHIHTPIKAILKKDLSNLDIIRKLHPTPAVGGIPQKEALEFIKEHEPFHRGLYAAPIGMVDSHSSEFAVGIRSALIKGNEVTLFGGAGIVLESDAKEEWIETENKMKNFTEIFHHE
ncbi:MAG: isochorismate synthase [Oligoflexia bacterium]|nr:isochorismate synthase [Oligoflexia bacterium]